MSRVITFGEIMLRLSPEGFNRLFQNDKLCATFGGAESNVAVSLAYLGINSAFVTKLPNNAIGEAALKELRYHGVDTSLISRGGDRLGIYYMEKGASQRGSVCIYDRAHSAMHESGSQDFDWDKIFDGADWFHFTGITPALGDNVACICREACEIAKKKSIIISCDLNFRSKLWSSEKAKTVMTELCKYVDVCIANEEDVKTVFGIEAKDTDIYSGKLSVEGYKSVAVQLFEIFNFKKVAFTLRESVSASENKWSGLLCDKDGSCISKQYNLNIVDRVGGGDSFGAGLIYSFLTGKSNQEAIEFAVAASALKHSIEGDFNLVSLSEINRLVTGDASGRIRR